MFALNLDTLRHDQSIKANYSAHQLDALALGARAKGRDRPPIAWEMRRVILVMRLP